MGPAAIKRKYERRIIAILNKIRGVLTDAGYNVCEPFDSCDGTEYRWSIVVQVGENDKEVIDITFSILESESDGEDGGVNFDLNVVDYEGHGLGGLTPYNYSNSCWVPRKDSAAVEKRFKIMEDADANEILSCVEESDMVNT